MSKRYYFTVTLSGDGSNEDEAWNNAVEAFELDPGVAPEVDCVEDLEEDC